MPIGNTNPVRILFHSIIVRLIEIVFCVKRKKELIMTVDLIQPCPDPFNAAEYCFAKAISQHANKPALIFVQETRDPQISSYKEVWNAILSIAHGIQKIGLAPQSRIAIHLPSSPDYAFAFFAAMLAGFIPIPSYENLKEEELLFLIKDSQCTLLITSNRFLKVPCKTVHIEELKQALPLPLKPATRANDPAFLVYTSGTTERPKGVLHAHRMVWGRRIIQHCLLDISEKDVLLHTDPLNYTYTFGVQLMDTWSSAATALLYAGERTSSIWPSLIQQFKVTLFASTPSIYEQMSSSDLKNIRLSSLRHAICAGDVLKQITIENWEKETSIPLYEALGMTEINLFISTDHTTPRKKGSIGKPQPGRKVAVLPLEGGIIPIALYEIGCLAVHRSDPGLMLGYWNRPEEEKEAFREDWFLTGDLVHQDEEGYIFFHGRMGTLLKIESDMISPAEIEATLAYCPGIQEVGCWAVEGPNRSPILALFVVPQKGQHPTELEILAFAKERFSDYKCPKKVFFLKNLPRDSRGKLQRRQLPGKIPHSIN